MIAGDGMVIEVDFPHLNTQPSEVLGNCCDFALGADAVSVGKEEDRWIMGAWADSSGVSR